MSEVSMDSTVLAHEIHERQKDEIRVRRKKQIRQYLRASFLPASPDERLLAILEDSAFQELEVRLNDPNSFLWRNTRNPQHQEASSSVEQVSHPAPASSFPPDMSATDLNVANDGNIIEAQDQRHPREVVLIRRLFSNVNNMAELANLTDMLVSAGYSEEECFQIYKLGSIDDGEDTETLFHHTDSPLQEREPSTG